MKEASKVYVIMFHSGYGEDQCITVKRVFTNRIDAQSYTDNNNHFFSKLKGRKEAANILLRQWQEKNPKPDFPHPHNHAGEKIWQLKDADITDGDFYTLCDAYHKLMVEEQLRIDTLLGISKGYEKKNVPDWRRDDCQYSIEEVLMDGSPYDDD